MRADIPKADSTIFRVLVLFVLLLPAKKLCEREREREHEKDKRERDEERKIKECKENKLYNQALNRPVHAGLVFGGDKRTGS